jgi:DNA polymerase elongation subunit (family B)
MLITKPELEDVINNNPSWTQEDLAEHFTCSIQALKSAITRHKVEYTIKTSRKHLSIKSVQAYIINNPKWNVSSMSKVFKVSIITMRNFLLENDLLKRK